MAKCLFCGQNVPQTKGKKTRQFCNDACRMAYKRKSEQEGKSEQFKSEQIKSEQANPNKPEQTELRKLSAQELYTKIDGYQSDKWAKSPEYLELLRRLKTMSIKDLRKEGFSVPSWKNHGLECPFDAQGSLIPKV